ncbi:MAG: G1 family glutamic endopeptidase [Candidatus Bathyarchaeia archaeon]
MKTSTALTTFFVGSLVLLALFCPALALSSLITAQGMSTESINGSSWYSTNWSGYAVTGSTGSVTSVQGSWTVPTVTGNRRTTAYSSFWVGIDGFSSNTVEQIGTDSDIQNGRALYYAWYEFYPNPMYQITALSISPGDVISATVTYQSSKFVVSITDTNPTTSKSTSWTSKPTTVSGATESSAEWIAEAPSSYRGVLPLANFGTVNFGQDYTNVAGTCYATIGGVTGYIGSFGLNVQTITMATLAYNFRTHGYTIVPKAVPSLLSTDGSSFSVTWASAGP